MCFDNDYDWYASICEVTDEPRDTPAKCYECGAVIEAGAIRRHIFMQEHEECQRCELEQLDDDADPCVEHDYGEVFGCSICESCAKILKSIERLEAKEGCPEHARQPVIGELGQSLWGDFNYGDGKYSKQAVSDFPELAGHKLIPN